MATIPTTVQGTYGISNTLDGCTIESENITTNRLVETVPDQKNAVANEIEYDTRIDLRLTVRGTFSGDTITYDGKKFNVDSVERAGTYNGLQRLNITAHRYTNCPTEA